MTETRVAHVLESALPSVEEAEQAVLEVALRSGFDEEVRGQIAIAVREATVNAILHGNRYDPAKRVTLSIETTPERLTIRVRDEGLGLNQSTLPDPLTPTNYGKSSGRGIFIIRAYMDEVEFLDASPGTEIRMTKFLHPTA
jgi:serine/threonine-protein kinase RsbW